MPPMLDLNAINSRFCRFHLMKVLHISAPINGATEQTLQLALQGIGWPATSQDVRRQLFYLKQRGLVEIIDESKDVWSARLTPDGMDVMEETKPFPDFLSKS